MLIAKLFWDMPCTMFDIVTEFLHVDLDEENYTEVPKGLTIGNNKKSVLRKTIYGLEQSAIKFYEKSSVFQKLLDSTEASLIPVCEQCGIKE
jgi:hypothetical protein